MGLRRDFRDKVVFITGAAGGMGRAISRRFGQAGARLAVTDLDGRAVRGLADELRVEGVECLDLGLDVTDEAACNKAVDTVVNHFGRLDVLVNNAGITHRSALADTTTGVYQKVMAVNFFGSLHLTKAALDQLILSRGLIVVISSIAGFSPLLGRTGYSASKHALHGLFDSLRAELRGTGVGVSIVCPGFTATGIDRNALGGDGQLTTHPQSTVGKAARPEAVAEVLYKAARRDKRLVVLSGVGRLTRVINKISPALFERLMSKAVASELDRG